MTKNTSTNPTDGSTNGANTNNKSTTNEIYFDHEIRDVSEFPKHSRMLEAMACCHSITRIHGDLAGDPLDCKMFEFTKWELTEPNPEETENFDSFAPPKVTLAA